jgi:hypothetical protein
MVVLPLADSQTVGTRPIAGDAKIDEAGSLGEASKTGGEGLHTSSYCPGAKVVVIQPEAPGTIPSPAGASAGEIPAARPMPPARISGRNVGARLLPDEDSDFVLHTPRRERFSGRGHSARAAAGGTSRDQEDAVG